MTMTGPLTDYDIPPLTTTSYICAR
jgi:hypothetical protein